MNFKFDLNDFIQCHVTRRRQSLLAEDFVRHRDALDERISSKRVLVIGGAGSIGSHYIKALLRYDVAALCVMDTNENGLTELVRDLRSAGCYRIPKNFVTYPVNFRDRVFAKIVEAHGPFDIVANFAAHKHVRSEKDIFSIEAMIENNVLAAHDLIAFLADSPPEHFFCVSTDKAANPVNIMGASKKLMEEMIMAYAGRLPVKTARFANVAFSNGSLPLGFLERLQKRQPWACPLGIRRFFVSPMESGELCLIASVIGSSGDIVFPKLDEATDMIPFEQIAHDLLHALGMEADVCATEEEAIEKMVRLVPDLSTQSVVKWPVYFFASDTSGEKSFEEFFTDAEELDLATFAQLGIVKNAPRRAVSEITSICAELRALFASRNATKEQVVHVLRHYLPNFAHIETGKSLDQKM
ncbi:MAG: SDR family NAD(P)-dependent oxidoreductase [Kiritimatiellaeota bacterium]|nr:SDR family NAD(P)-dependent oxidoreductase [Kiritimatiellota bacterium]